MKFLKIGAYLVVLISLVCLYSSLVLYSASEGDKLGKLKTPLYNFANFPNYAKKVIRSPEANRKPTTYLSPKSAFVPVNKLSTDLYGLTSFWNNKNYVWEIKLLNFKNDSTIYKWYFKKEHYDFHINTYQNSLPFHSILYENKEIIINIITSPSLIKLDSNSNVVWKNSELLFHHSLNKDSDSYLWTCGMEILDENNRRDGFQFKNLNGRIVTIGEEYLVKVEPASGDIIYKKGVAAILVENGYKGIVYSGTNFEPLHLNDVQPVLKDGPYWKKGDLFVSLRGRSIIFLYRPSTNKIIKLIHGPFVNQHDVDIISEHEIALFNNNTFFPATHYGIEAYMPLDSLNSSEIIIYNFETDSFKYHLKDQLIENNVGTTTQGLYHFLENGDVFIEEQNNGIYYILNEKEVLYRNVFFTPDSNYWHRPNWIRVYETIPFIQ